MTRNAARPAAVGVAVLALLAQACSPAVRLQQAEDLETAPPALVSPEGELSPNGSRRILERLTREAGADERVLGHVATVEHYADSPLVMGNRVRLLRDGPATYHAMENAIRAARHHVNLEVYTFSDDALGRRFASLLVARAGDGIAVNVVYDSVGCLGTDPAFFDRMRAAGVRTVEFNPISPADARGEWRLEHRDHRKLLIVDNRVAFTGGVNFSTEYSGRLPGSGSRGRSGGTAAEPPWRDTHVEIEGPVVAEFQKLFRETWQKQHGPALDWDGYFQEAPVAGTQVVRALGSTPDDAISVFHTTMVSAIARAADSVHLTQMYFVPDDELLEVVQDAARRGVDVRLILPEDGLWLTRYAGRARYRGLLEAGVRVYERRGPLLHAKTAVIDGIWSTVGSANIDARSLVKNDEVNAVILGEDFAAELEAMFHDDLAASREITLAAWKKRGFGTRAKEAIATIWSRWL